jgi:CRP-like cAMP-binding protein
MGCGASAKKYEEGGGTESQRAPKTKEDDKQASKDQNKDFAQTMTFLTNVPLFKRLPKDQHPLLAAACVQVDFAADATIIQQGDTGNEFFIIKSGKADVIINGDQVATLKTGDYFGENALLRDEPRLATIKAAEPLTAFKITRDKFTELGLTDKLHFANRKAVAAGGAGKKLATKAPSPKTDQERELMAKALKGNDNLMTMVSLDDARIQAMIDVAWKETVAPGKEVITEGALEADYFYIVQEGTFEIFVTEGSEGASSADKIAKGGLSKMVSTVEKGGSFGELALLYLVPRAATVKAKSEGVVWVIDRNNFKSILLKVSDEKLAEYVKYLDRVEILGPLLADEKKALASALIEMHFTKEEVILQQGEPGNTFYILYEGEVVVTKDGKEVTTLSASQSRKTAEFFGERALMSKEERAATITVRSATAKALALDRDSFNMLLGPLEDLIKRSQEDGNRGSNVKSQKGSVSTNPNDKPRDKILRKDLVKIGLLGCGGFGAVELFEHKKTKETYAMKGISKGYIVKTNMQDSVMNEKNILMMTNSAFIIKLFECYNGSQTLYFLMEPALGGELYATYNRRGFHGSDKHCKYYSAGTVYAFQHCHERRIIYRDLKPENLLMNDKGHVKLTDMGLAKFVIGKTYTTCGTPDYFAPEVIASTGHTNALDWWTLGILIFELMSGHPPFESAYPMQIYSKVMKGITKVPFPPKCQGPVGDMVKALLKREPSERLPMRPGGVKNMKDHKWYQGFGWDQMVEGKLEPPYSPVVKSKKDIANFTARKEDMPKSFEFKDDGTGWDKDFAT